MATKKAGKSTKHLRRAKNLEATKPLAKGTHIPKVIVELTRPSR